MTLQKQLLIALISPSLQSAKVRMWGSSHIPRPQKSQQMPPGLSSPKPHPRFPLQYTGSGFAKRAMQTSPVEPEEVLMNSGDLHRKIKKKLFLQLQGKLSIQLGGGRAEWCL